MNHSIKFFLIAVLLTAIIIGAAIFTRSYLKRSSEALEGHIINIEENTKSGNWDIVEEEVLKMNKIWSKTEFSWSILLDHIEIDNIDNTMSKMETFVESKDPTLTLSEAASLKQYIKHIPEKESFNIKNIF